MSWWQRFVQRVTGRADADLDREIRAHLEQEADEQRAEGASPAQAHDAARRAFGSTALTKESVREAWGWMRLEQALQDVRFGVRTLRRSPAFTTVAILSLALGIGANTTIFTFLNAIVLRPLPYPDPNRIVFVQERPLLQDKTVNVHPFNFLQWQARARSFQSMALAQMIPFNTMGPDGAEQVPAIMTTVELFRVFGVAPFLGRWLTPEDASRRDDVPQGGVAQVVIVSYEFWRRRLNADPDAIGKPLIVNNTPNVVVGVTPPGFRVGTLAPDLYVPMAIDPAKPDSIGSRSFMCFGRVRPDRDVIAGRAELTAIAAQLSRETPLDKNFGVSVLSLHEYMVQSSRRILALLMGVVSMVLLIACFNLASLLLTRGVGRQQELAIRASLGAGRLRLVQQLVIESLVLSAAGGALGILLAQGATRVLLALTKTALMFGRVEEVQIDWAVLAFTIGLSTVTALLCGLLPAWSACRIDPQVALREQGRGRSGGARHTRFRGALVVGEVALAVVLLVGSGLLLRTFSKMLQIDLGFRPEHILTMQLFLPDGDPARRVNTIERIIDRVNALPDVVATSTIKFLPVAGGTSGTGFRIDRDGALPEPWRLTEVSLISRGYFAAMGIPVREGRAFDARDRLGSPRVAIVSRAFARRFFPDGRALGRSITVQWADEVPSEVVGVVGDVSYTELTTEPRPTVYLLHAQSPGYVMHLVIRASGDPARMAASVRHELQAVDPTKSVSAVKTMDEYLNESLARPRLYAAMLAAFAALALLLAGIGLYGLIAYGVSQRTHEIGIRMALGAQRGSVTGAVLWQGARLAITGLAIGIASALMLTRLLESLLYGVTATDATTYGGVAIVLAAVASIAAFIPARRAALLDPMIALRCE